MIETERLLLRRWRAGDRSIFLALCNSPAVTEHLGGPATRAQVDAGIARIHASQARHGYCSWAVERRVDGAFLGFCGLERMREAGTPIEHDLEIGWRLREDAWGQGYGQEAAAACLDWAWANTDAARVVAITVAANHRSEGLMRRLSMVRRPDLDFGHAFVPKEDPLHRHIVYASERPGGVSAPIAQATARAGRRGSAR